MIAYLMLGVLAVLVFLSISQDLSDGLRRK